MAGNASRGALAVGRGALAAGHGAGAAAPLPMDELQHLLTMQDGGCSDIGALELGHSGRIWQWSLLLLDVLAVPFFKRTLDS